MARSTPASITRSYPTTTSTEESYLTSSQGETYRPNKGDSSHLLLRQKRRSQGPLLHQPSLSLPKWSQLKLTLLLHQPSLSLNHSLPKWSKLKLLTLSRLRNRLRLQATSAPRAPRLQSITLDISQMARNSILRSIEALPSTSLSEWAKSSSAGTRASLR